MKQQRTDARSLTADQQKRIEEVCFRSLALIGHNCEYLEQHFDRTGADESTRQAVADINAAAVKLDRTLSEAMTLLEFLRGDEKPQLYPVDLCDLLRQVEPFHRRNKFADRGCRYHEISHDHAGGEPQQNANNGYCNVVCYAGQSGQAEHFQAQTASKNQDIENSAFPFSGC